MLQKFHLLDILVCKVCVRFDWTKVCLRLGLSHESFLFEENLSI